MKKEKKKKKRKKKKKLNNRAQTKINTILVNFTLESDLRYRGQLVHEVQ